jgi:hypothetical protein
VYIKCFDFLLFRLSMFIRSKLIQIYTSATLNHSDLLALNVFVYLSTVIYYRRSVLLDAGLVSVRSRL